MSSIQTRSHLTTAEACQPNLAPMVEPYDSVRIARDNWVVTNVSDSSDIIDSIDVDMVDVRELGLLAARN